MIFTDFIMIYAIFKAFTGVRVFLHIHCVNALCHPTQKHVQFPIIDSDKLCVVI